MGLKGGVMLVRPVAMNVFELILVLLQNRSILVVQLVYRPFQVSRHSKVLLVLAFKLVNDFRFLTEHLLQALDVAVQ